MNYENTLLKYLIGNLEKNIGNDVIRFGDYKIVNKSMRQQIAEKLETELKNVVIRGGVSSNNDNKNLLYGIDLGNSKTFISIFNQQMELIQVIQTFATGSDLFNIISIQIDENGEMYGLSRDNSTLRILLLNNIFASGLTSGDYVVKLRKDYIIPSTSNLLCTTQATKDIIKKVPGEATYYVTGYDNSNNTYTKVVKFQINVGSENNWDTYTIGTNVYYAQSKFTVMINKENDNYIYYAYGLDILNNKYVVYKIDESGNITNLKSINLTGDISWTGSQVLAVNENNVYLAIGNLTSHETLIYKVIGNSLNIIEQISWWKTPGDEYVQSFFYLQNVNNNIFVTKYIPDKYAIQIFFGIIIGSTIYYKAEEQRSSIQIDTENFNLLLPFTNTYINNQYNLYNIYIDSDYNNQSYGENLNTLSFVYNSNNYNGEAYENINALIPNNGVIYNDNIPIFARNLYNKTLNDNTTISTIEIPNNLLNDISIQKKSLFSETNLLLTTNDTMFIKNIYETIYLNFINLIEIVNNNNDNSILNQNASNKLNYAINNPAEYENTKLNKYRINYEDGTTTVSFFDIETPVAPYYQYILTLTFYLSKKATNLEFISNDEKIVYCTIDLSNYEINKIYSLKQRVRIGGQDERRK